jgi:hypothetical protein
VNKLKIKEKMDTKILRSPEVNYNFSKVTGVSQVWGKTYDEDPDYSPYGPFIADIEITTICSGINNVPCPFCYKSNTMKGSNMSLETFKKVFYNLPNTLQQIAFGVDSKCTSNPDTMDIFWHCRDNGVIPNVTVADISDETAQQLSEVCGAVAVSRYKDKNYCYDSVKRLTDKGMTQVNIHQMLSAETLREALETIRDIQTDPRLAKLNAIVFLSLKKTGRGTLFNTLTQIEFKYIVDLCLEKGIRFGFDSCSAGKFLKSVKDHPMYEKFYECSEPCESTRFSAYINVFGKFSPCSFLDDKDGLDMVNCKDFMEDIWNHPKTVAFRTRSIKCLSTNQGCPVYEV